MDTKQNENAYRIWRNTCDLKNVDLAKVMNKILTLASYERERRGRCGAETGRWSSSPPPVNPNRRHCSTLLSNSSSGDLSASWLTISRISPNLTPESPSLLLAPELNPLELWTLDTLRCVPATTLETSFFCKINNYHALSKERSGVPGPYDVNDHSYWAREIPWWSV